MVEKIISDEVFLKESFDQYTFVKFVKTRDDTSKIKLLNKPSVFGKFNVQAHDIRKIIMSMSEKSIEELMSNRELINQYGLNEFYITAIITNLGEDSVKKELAQKYELSKYNMVNVIKSFSDDNKKTAIIDDEYGFYDYQITSIIESMQIDVVIDFINNHQTFLEYKDIKPFQIIKEMSSDKQLQIVQQLNNFELTEGEIRRIVACLKNETKEQIKTDEIDAKYRALLEIELSEDDEIILRLDGDLTVYQDLEDLLNINPLELIKTDEDRQRLLELCKICPDICIYDNLLIGCSTGEEFIEAEAWIDTILQGIQREWTDVQKLAYIDTAIGKRVSYTPEFGTEAEPSGDARALWKIIANRYGVCNGIAQVEQYILGRVGIEAELVSSKIHCFVKVKNIKVPTENGIVEGDTLVDPTWNLTASRFGAMPQHFCKSYGELRKVESHICYGDGLGIKKKMEA